jgi:hypothetical protein
MDTGGTHFVVLKSNKISQAMEGITSVPLGSSCPLENSVAAPEWSIGDQGTHYEMSSGYHGTDPKVLPKICTHGLGTTTGAGGRKFTEKTGMSVTGFYMTDAIESANDYAGRSVVARTLPVALSLTLELITSHNPHWIDAGKFPKNATAKAKASAVKPNQQQFLTATDLHINRILIKTHPFVGVLKSGVPQNMGAVDESSI